MCNKLSGLILMLLFVRALAEAVHLVSPHLREDCGFHDLRRRLVFSVAGPIILLGAVNAYMQWSEHWEHVRNTPPDEINVEYPYQNIRVKKYPWGDGDKTLL